MKRAGIVFYFSVKVLHVDYYIIKAKIELRLDYFVAAYH